jgi:hypothetical protein
MELSAFCQPDSNRKRRNLIESVLFFFEIISKT